MTKNDTKIKKTRRKTKKPYNSINYTTGDIGLNIGHFNRTAGTADLSITGEGSLTEAKRYVRRYYIRPQNIFCSNKAEILKALIELDDMNCSVYTLNNLGDEKDVSKLMNSDIIYYYDDGILYDKNKVKVMDYDLSIKKEEKRKQFTNIDKAPEKEFRAEYKDRMTDATGLEESYTDDLAGCGYDIIRADFTEKGDQFVVSLNHGIDNLEEAASEISICLSEIGIYTLDWSTNGNNIIIYDLNVNEDPFNLDFDDINAYGERLNEAKEHYCSVCGEPIEGSGKSTDNGIVCDSCDLHFSIGG